MKLRDYIELLNDYVTENPDTLDMTVVHTDDSISDGDPYFWEVNGLMPLLGNWDGDHTFTADYDDMGELEINSVWLN